jgi:hypothetical protein
MATEAEVERAIKTLAKKLADAAPEPEQVPERSIVCVLPDLKTAYWAELKGARLKGLKTVPQTEKGDVRLTAKSDDLIALIEGRLGIGSAFFTGRVRVDAPARDLMLLRRLF